MRKLLWFSCGFAAAALLFVYQAAHALTAALLAGALALLLLRPKQAIRRRAVALFLGAVCSFGWCAAYQTLLLPDLSGLPEGKTAFSAVICEPVRLSGTRLSAEAEICWDGHTAPGVLYLPTLEEDLLPGDRVEGTAFLRAENRGGDLAPQGSRLIANAQGRIGIKPLSEISIRYLPAYAAHALRESVKRVFPAEGRGFFLALVTGDRSGLSYELKNRLSVCGLYHAIALSGMHVAVLAGFLTAFCGRRRRLAALLGIPVVWFFTLLSGAAASTVRAAVMQSILLFAPLLDREYDAPTALGGALLLILLENPWSIAQYGMQMSFLACAGILLLSEKLTQRLTPEAWREGKRYAPLHYAISIAAVSLSAIAVTQPLSALYFGVGSLVAIPVNVLCIWAVTLCFSGGLLAALAGLFMPGVAAGAAWALSWIWRYVDRVTAAFAALPVPAFYGETPFLLAWLCFACVMIPAILLLSRRRWAPTVALLLTLLLCVAFTHAEMHGSFFSVLDVGQGQSLVWHDGDQTAVIDCGGAGQQSGEIAARTLLSHGIRRVDALILTHFDRDHVEGVSQLSSRVRIMNLCIPDAAGSDEVCALAESKKIPVTRVRTKRELFGGALSLLPPTLGKTGNEGCLSVLASAAECDILITGDLPQSEERALLSREALPDLEVFIAGHHGSADATGEALLRKLRPELVLISVGVNSYGHPAQAALDRIAASGSEAATTLENGTMTIRW